MDNKNSNTALVEIIETLEVLSEIEPEHFVQQSEEKIEEKLEKLDSYKTLRWIQAKDVERVVSVARESFKQVLTHLKDFYQKEINRLSSEHSMEVIHHVMSLAGKTATRLDSFLQKEANKSIKESKEWKELLFFYEKNVTPLFSQHKLLEGVKHVPFKSLIKSAKREEKDRFVEKHLIIDLESAKRDEVYELFFIRRQDGQRFFSPKLLHNVKLVSGLESYFGAKEKEELFSDFKEYENIFLRGVAFQIENALWNEFDLLIKESEERKEHPLSIMLYKTVMALMLSSQDVHQIGDITKQNRSYFHDFQVFLREIMKSSDYQRFLAFHMVEEESLEERVHHIVKAILKKIFLSSRAVYDMLPFVERVIRSKRPELIEAGHHLTTPMLSYNLSMDYESCHRATCDLNYIPLLRIVDEFKQGHQVGFDPLLMKNIPSVYYKMESEHTDMRMLKMASPTYQEYNGEAEVVEEFKGFLRILKEERPVNKMLIFNLQDRSSWKEFSRSHALEMLQKRDEFHDVLNVVTMSKQSDFYFQEEEYEHQHEAKTFIKELLRTSQDHNDGFYYPEKVQEELFPRFMKELSEVIWQLFFGGRNMLGKQKRLDFIELFYMLFQIKIMETLSPQIVSCLCKDSLDVSIPHQTGMFILLKLLNLRPLSKEEENVIKVFLFGFPLLSRGRILFPDRFTRMNSMIKTVERAQEELGDEKFKRGVQELLFPLFSTSILRSTLSM